MLAKIWWPGRAGSGWAKSFSTTLWWTNLEKSRSIASGGSFLYSVQIQSWPFGFKLNLAEESFPVFGLRPELIARPFRRLWGVHPTNRYMRMFLTFRHPVSLQDQFYSEFFCRKFECTVPTKNICVITFQNLGNLG